MKREHQVGNAPLHLSSLLPSRGRRGHTASAVMLLVAALGCTPGITDEELEGRVDASRPAWESYQEDLKSQIGAGPVAQWEGVPVKVRAQRRAVHVTFRLTAPWAHRDAALPILMREPLGGVHRNLDARCDGDRVTYLFECPQSASGTPFPWIELKYPRHQKRIVLSDRGEWETP